MPMLYHSSKSSHPGELSRKKLAKADYSFSSPFLLTLAHHEEPLICEEMARLIPGKRLVAFGRWNNRPIVAKIFFSRQAKLHMQRDLRGAKALAAAKIPTPALLHTDSTKDKAMHILIFERIENAESLESFWQRNKALPESETLLQALTIELATQHVLGLQQDDLHLKNFLVAADKIYTLDGANIRTHEGPLSKKQSLENLALFFSQLGIHTNKLQQRLFTTYVAARSWLLKKSDLRFLKKTLHQWNAKRWLAYSRKIFRSSTQFAKVKKFSLFALYDRAYSSTTFQQFLDKPDAVFTAATTRILKAGRTSTVAEVTLGQHKLVVKRYNIKDFWHGLGLLFKPSRARLSWRLAHQLQFVGLPTAKPVAFIEKRFLGLRRQAYFVMEYIEGSRADAFFETHAPDSKQSTTLAKRIITLFFNLARLRLSHGDLKITNILLTPHLEPVLIDLDGMREHRSALSLWHRFSKDLQRFLENWQGKPALHQLFQGLIAEMQAGTQTPKHSA
jgi:tRNA A-37 threonylcarbamoyl transferase component Bud32